ncbi:hypothetical protein Tco_1508811 [Tanacetum coccineum]
MDIIRDQQIALDDALVAPANRLKIGKSNLRLSSDLNSKEATLQVVYDVLKLTTFYKAFQITTDVLEIYMQEEMLQICPKLPDQQFKELPSEEEILTSFAGVINKCLSGKSTGYDSLRLSQAQILGGIYHKKNVDYAYLLWKEFVYQVENKNVKRSNEMYYPRFTKVIVNFFMTKDSSIPRKNRVNRHFARDDPMFTTIKVVSRHEDTQLYGAIFPDELTNETIKDFESYKEYYAISSGAEPPKTKASVKKKQTGSNKTKAPPTTKGKRLKTLAKAAKPAKKKQPAKASKAKGLTVLSEVALIEAEQMDLATKRSLIQTHSSHASGLGTDEGTYDKPGVLDEDDEEVAISGDDDDDADNQDDDDNDDDDQNDDNDDDDGQDHEGQDDDNEQTDSDNDGDDFVHPKFSTHNEENNEEEGSDMRVQTPSHYESTDDEESDEITHGANVEGEELDEEETNEEDEANELYRDVNPPLLSAIILPPLPTILITHLQQTPVPTPATVPSSSLQDLPNFVSLFGFDHRNKTLETDFSEFKQTNQFTTAVSSIPGIVDAYLANKMHEAVKIAVQLQSKILRDKAQAKNEDFINKLDDNIKKIIKAQVKEQVKAQVSKIFLKIKKTVNEQLEAEVLTRSSNESKISHAVATNLSELELKKILIDKMESNKSIHRSDEQKNLYKALVDAYESDKLILDIGANAHAKDLEELAHQEFVTGDTEDKPDEETSQLLDWLKVDTLTPELLVGLTFELMKGSCKSLVELEYFFEEVYKATTNQLDWNNPEVIPFDYFINNDLAYLSGGVSSRTYTTSVMKTKAADYGHIKWIKDLVPNRMESARNVYSKRRIVAVTNLQIVEWHNYKHLDWITVHRDDDNMYTFKEGDFNRLRIQDIEDMLLLLIQGKLTNLTVEERLAFNVSLRIFTRSIVIQRRLEDLQLGVESYQKKLNLTKPDTYRSDRKQREAYTAYSNPRGFIYHNKDKKNRLMRIDELHKFCDGTFNDVQTALNDRLKGIRMKYLPQTIWTQSNRDKAGAMI